ncbi:MAG TPA: Calx-beta domain-containing protein, partial [Chroococcidiopsis sp.]
PTVSISPASITQLEGNSGTTAYVYTVTLSNASASPITVNYSTNNGTATAGSDYVDNDGALVFNPGDPLTQTITVLVNGDTTVEGDETFTVQLNSAVNAVLGTNTATGTLTNDDTAQASFSLSQILTDGDGVVFNGRATGDFAGGVASNAGDLNNDGFDDILISARKADPSGRTDAGEAYVIFGNATGTYPTSLSSLNGSNGFRLEGIARFDGNGFAGQSAGDINGDGFDDLILGARTADANGKSDSGQAYVIFGQAGGFTSSVNLSTLNGTNGFRINGEKQYDNAGHSVSGIGDIDGDGFDDIAISAVGSDPSARSNAGQVYVLFGKRGGFSSSLNLSSLPTTGGNATGFRLSGLVAGDSLGYSLSGAGDLNNDGRDDFIIGATGADPNGSNSGQAYVVFGSAGLKTSGLSDLGALNGSNGFRINGVAANDNAGLAVTSIGDMNNDGIDDIAIASPYADPSNPNAGAVYVVFGKTGGFSSSLNLSSLNGSNGFRLTGIDADDLTGLAISSAGDFNKDGIDDLLIGAPYADPSGTSSGEAYVVYGSSSSFAASISLASLNGSNGLTITGITANSLTGFSVGSGNFNGSAGLLLGAPNSGNGTAYAIFNSILS